MEVVAAPVCVEHAEQPVAGYRLADAVEAGCRTFLVAKEHREVLSRGIVHRHHQVPAMTDNPFMAAGILMHHHPRQRFAVALLAVSAASLGSDNRTGLL